MGPFRPPTAPQAAEREQAALNSRLHSLDASSPAGSDDESQSLANGDAHGAGRGRGRKTAAAAAAEGRTPSHSPAPSPPPPPKRRGGRPKSNKNQKPPADFATLLKILKPKDVALQQEIVKTNQATAAAAREHGTATLLPPALRSKRAAAGAAAANALAAAAAEGGAAAAAAAADVLQPPKRVDPCDTKPYKAQVWNHSGRTPSKLEMCTERTRLARAAHDASCTVLDHHNESSMQCSGWFGCLRNQHRSCHCLLCDEAQPALGFESAPAQTRLKVVT